jgi:putrescine transport system permease protein
MPYGWLLLFFLLPFLILAKISVSEMENVRLQGPDHLQGRRAAAELKLGNYVFITEDALYSRPTWPA